MSLNRDSYRTPIADELSGMCRLYPRDERFVKVILKVAELERKLEAQSNGPKCERCAELREALAGVRGCAAIEALTGSQAWENVVKELDRILQSSATWGGS